MKLKFLVLLGVSLFLISCKKTVVIEVRPAPEPITLVGTTFLDFNSNMTSSKVCLNRINFIDEQNIVFSYNISGQVCKIAEFSYTCDEISKEISFQSKGIYTFEENQRFLSTPLEIAEYYYSILVEENGDTEEELIKDLAEIFDCDEDRTSVISEIQSLVSYCFDQTFTCSYEFGERVSEGAELEAFGLYRIDLDWNEQPNGIFDCRKHDGDVIFPLLNKLEGYSINGYSARTIKIRDENIFTNKDGKSIKVSFSDVIKNQWNKYVVHAYVDSEKEYEYVFKPLSIADLMYLCTYGLLEM